MAHSVGETELLHLSDEDPGLVTAAKVISAAERIVALTNPQRVVAFGSRARGDHRRDSDLDLAVIVDKYDPKVDKRPIWRADADEWMDMDILVYDAERERRLRESPKQGVLLYANCKRRFPSGMTNAVGKNNKVEMALRSCTGIQG